MHEESGMSCNMQYAFVGMGGGNVIEQVFPIPVGRDLGKHAKSGELLVYPTEDDGVP